jgi:hypothetical protein
MSSAVANPRLREAWGEFISADGEASAAAEIPANWLGIWARQRVEWMRRAGTVVAAGLNRRGRLAYAGIRVGAGRRGRGKGRS